jgi:hypothetical protein
LLDEISSFRFSPNTPLYSGLLKTQKEMLRKERLKTWRKNLGKVLGMKSKDDSRKTKVFKIRVCILQITVLSPKLEFRSHSKYPKLYTADANTFIYLQNELRSFFCSYNLPDGQEIPSVFKALNNLI